MNLVVVPLFIPISIALHFCYPPYPKDFLSLVTGSIFPDLEPWILNPKPHTDQRYIQALLDNDRKGIEEIYQRFSERIKAFVTANNGSIKDAQDLFQEALIAIYQKARKGNFVLTCPFEAYLYLVCRSKWMNELKKRKKAGVTINELEGSHYDNQAQNLAEGASLQEQQDALFQKAFNSLSEGCRQLLRLSWAGEHMEKVAQQLEVSYGYARKKKSECMAKLMKRIKASPDYERIRTGAE